DDSPGIAETAARDGARSRAQKARLKVTPAAPASASAAKKSPGRAAPAKPRRQRKEGPRAWRRMPGRQGGPGLERSARPRDEARGRFHRSGPWRGSVGRAAQRFDDL